ncbi:MAG: hypothetical protein ACYCVD_02015 [Desulfitobacteriaceae bacterium]
MEAGETPNLSQFVAAYLQRIGALAEPCGYAALEVLMPDDQVGQFGEDHLLMAFDVEVAGENPGSVFVTHGSPALDKTVESILQSYGRLTALYRPGSPPEFPHHFEQKVLAKLEFQRCRTPKVSLHTVEEYVYYAFYFRCRFRSYEQSEEMLPIVLNGSNGQIQPEFLHHWQRQVPAEEREYSVPKVQLWPIEKLYTLACREIEEVARSRSGAIMAQGTALKKKERAKLLRYYGEMEAQLRRKLTGTEEPSKKARIEQQLAATLADRDRREKDLNERYGVEVDARLDHVVAYHVPCLRVKLELQHKDKVLSYTVLYNPVIGGIETPICEHCGRPATRFLPVNDGFICGN